MYCCTSKPVLQWFYAVSAGDYKYLRENPDELNSRDPRETDEDNNIFHGFTALHYAIVLNKQYLFDYLLTNEWRTTTGSAVRLHTPLLPGSARIQLASGQDCLNLAVASGNEDCVYKIMSYPFLADLLNKVDDDGNSHLMIAAYFPYSKVVADVLNSKQILQELACQSSKTFLYVCCMLGRIQHINVVFGQLLDKTAFYTQFFSIYQNQTVFASLSVPVDQKKCNFTAEDRDQCREFLYANISDAYNTLRAKQYDFKAFLNAAPEDVCKLVTDLAESREVNMNEIGIINPDQVHELETETEKIPQSEYGQERDAEPVPEPVLEEQQGNTDNNVVVACDAQPDNNQDERSGPHE